MLMRSQAIGGFGDKAGTAEERRKAAMQDPEVQVG